MEITIPQFLISLLDVMNTSNHITLQHIKVAEHVVEYTFSTSSSLKKYFSTDKLIIDYSQDITNIPLSILSTSFVGCFMGIAWITDSVMHVPCIDKSYYDATFNIRSAFQDMHTHPLKGDIRADKIESNIITPSGNAILLFGGGIDANSSLIRHQQRISAICNIQGWFNNISDADKTTEAEFKYTSQIAKNNNSSSILIKSNFARVISPTFDQDYRKRLKTTWWYGFSHSMSFISITIPIAHKLNIGEIIIASSLSPGFNKRCASIPSTDGQIKYSHRGFVNHDAYELTRQDKTRIIVDHQQHSRTDFPLKVCSFNNKNCCKCEKCLRTILALAAEGADPRRFAFDILDTLTVHWADTLKTNIALMGFKNERENHWPHIIKRMNENYDNLPHENKEFVDWFLSFDFNKAKRIALFKYYIKNLFPILKRKLHL